MIGSRAVRRSVVVPLPPEDAFELFTTRISEWWPVTLRFVRGPVREFVFEGHLGGHVYEIATDGVITDFARVEAWEPPTRFVLSWFADRRLIGPTEVEVKFREDPEGCRVELEHRGFERYGELGEDRRTCYENGWPGVLERFVQRARAS